MNVLTDDEKLSIVETVVHMDFTESFTDCIDRVCELAQAAVIKKLAGVSVEQSLDGKRLDFLFANNAKVVSDQTCCDGYWLQFTEPGGITWVQTSEHETPRAAIDAAMKGEQHDTTR